MAIAIKCHGEFYAKNGQLKLTLPFEEVVKAPSLKFFEQTSTKLMGTDDNGQLKFKESSFLNVRGQLKKKLLPIILSKKYQGQFVRVRGVTIDEITSDTSTETIALPINLMSFTQLGALIKERNIPLDITAYVDVDDLRTDISEYLEDPDTFQHNYARKAKKRAEERAFMELNNLLPAQANIGSDAPKRAKKAKGVAEAASTPEMPF